MATSGDRNLAIDKSAHQCDIAVRVSRQTACVEMVAFDLDGTLVDQADAASRWG